MPLARQLHGQRLGERDHAALRRRVVRHVRRAGLRARRRDRDDAAPPGGEHVGHRRLHAGERAGEVHRDDAVPRLGRDVEQRIERLDAGARDEDLDRTELGADLLERGVDRGARSATSTSTAERWPHRPAARRPPPRRPLRSRTATWWPSATSCLAAPSPMPEAPPVTTRRRSIRGTLELEVQPGETAEDPRRLVVEVAIAGRAVVLLGQPDVAHAVEDALEADAALGPGERAAGAGVNARARRRCAPGRWAGRGGTRAGTRSAGVAVGGAVQQHHRRAGGMSTPATVVERWARRKSVFTGLSSRSTSSRKPGIRSWSVRSSSCSSGWSGQVPQGVGETVGGLLAGGEQEGRRPHDRGDLRRAAVGVGREREVGEHVLARLAPPVLDVVGEPLVEPGQRGLVAGVPPSFGAHHSPVPC